MTAIDRLAEIQARANFATEGPWAAWLDQDGAEHMHGLLMVGNAAAVIPDGQSWVEGVDVNPIAHAYCEEDRAFIAHARTDVPALVAALRAVLDLHKPMRIHEHEDSCEDESEEHREERHVESTESNGEYYCLDLSTGITLCAECSRDLDFDGRDYPCPTVRVVTEALEEEQS